MYLKILATNFWGIAIGTLIALILICLVAIVFQLGDQIGASMLLQLRSPFQYHKVLVASKS